MPVTSSTVGVAPGGVTVRKSPTPTPSRLAARGPSAISYRALGGVPTTTSTGRSPLRCSTATTVRGALSLPSVTDTLLTRSSAATRGSATRVLMSESRASTTDRSAAAPYRAGVSASRCRLAPNAAVATTPAIETVSPATVAAVRNPPLRQASPSPASSTGRRPIRAGTASHAREAVRSGARTATSAAPAVITAKIMARPIPPTIAIPHGGRKPGVGSKRAWLPSGSSMPAATTITAPIRPATAAPSRPAATRAADRSPRVMPSAISMR